jgi:DNA-binding LacI/PurR family transcriptional regulator
MPVISILSPSEQVAEYLRGELLRGRWMGIMPGVPTLANELEVDHKTVASAINHLEQDGILAGQGPGRPRRILTPKSDAMNSLRVALLDFDTPSKGANYMIDLVARLEHAGHVPFFTEKTLEDLRMDPARLARFVKKTEADVWVVCAGPREILAWFAQYEKPAFALFGRRGDFPIAGVGPDHVKVSRILIRRLIDLGHRRIVIIARQPRRLPVPGQCERAMLEEMEASGIPTGSYNLPGWDETPEGFHRLLDELFRISLPTALVIYEPCFYHAAKDYLARKGIFAPTQISMVCTDPDPTFAWCRPSISHFQWDYRPVVNRILRWVNNVAKGREDREQTLTPIEIVEGGTIGPAPE